MTQGRPKDQQMSKWLHALLWVFKRGWNVFEFSYIKSDLKHLRKKLFLIHRGRDKHYKHTRILGLCGPLKVLYVRNVCPPGNKQKEDRITDPKNRGDKQMYIKGGANKFTSKGDETNISNQTGEQKFVH